METQTSGTSSTVKFTNSSYEIAQKYHNIMMVVLFFGLFVNVAQIVYSVYNIQKTKYEFRLWSKDMDIKEMKTDVKEYLRRQGSLVNPSVETKLLMNKLGIN